MLWWFCQSSNDTPGLLHLRHSSMQSAFALFVPPSLPLPLSSLYVLPSVFVDILAGPDAEEVPEDFFRRCWVNEGQSVSKSLGRIGSGHVSPSDPPDQVSKNWRPY